MIKEKTMENERMAVYCIHCEMWFDTKKGWQAKKSVFGTPTCPLCSAPLLQLDYNDFIKQNHEQGRLEEVMTWEYPHGAYWKTKGTDNG
jgi:hypothetical protein